MKKFILLLNLLLPALAMAQTNLAIDWHAVAGGGGTCSTGRYSLSATLGQPYAGLIRSNNLTLRSGFWAADFDGGTCVWTNPASGKWEVSGNWSGMLPTNQLSIYITNAGTKTVTIDADTVANAPASLTINDLTLSAPGTDQLTLLLNNSGTNVPLHVLNSCSVYSNAAVVLTNAALVVEGNSVVDGTFSLLSGSATARADFLVGASLGSTGEVYVAAGTLSVSNGTMSIGPVGSGQMTISGGRVEAQKIHLGGAGASGKVICNAGFVRTTELLCNWWVGGGGDMDGCGGTMLLGAADHDSVFELHAGSSTNWDSICVGYGAGLAGAITNDGGIISATNNLVVGDCVNGATGTVSLGGVGALYVTNTGHTAVLDVRKGGFVMTGGLLVVDILRLTNVCGGAFSHAGGTLQYGQLEVDSNADADGDGQSNARELAAGTDPFNPASVFRLLSIARTNDRDIRIDWTTVGGHSYVVQTNGNLGGGAFHDLSGVISIGGTAEGTTSYVHPGALTNGANFYRVRLQP